jgi:molecular chaperone GrpE
VNKTDKPEIEDINPDTQPQTDKKQHESDVPQEKETKPCTENSDSELNRLRQDNDRLKQEIDDLKDLYQRVLAEYANYKRRTEQEKEQLSEYIKSETIKALLPAIDNLERAIEAPPGDEYKTGVDMTIRQLMELLSEQGLETIMPIGEDFNPEIHHAVMREDAKEVKPETVTEVFQKGYKLGKRLLRPAMVKVAN